MWSAEGAVLETLVAGTTTTVPVPQLLPVPIEMLKVPVAPVLVICQPQMKMDLPEPALVPLGGMIWVIVVGPAARMAAPVQRTYWPGPTIGPCADAGPHSAASASARKRRFIAPGSRSYWRRCK